MTTNQGASAAPTPERIKVARDFVGDTQAEAAARIYVGLRTWNGYEAGRTAMPSGLFELYLIKTGMLKYISTIPHHQS